MGLFFYSPISLLQAMEKCVILIHRSKQGVENFGSAGQEIIKGQGLIL